MDSGDPKSELVEKSKNKAKIVKRASLDEYVYCVFFYLENIVKI